MAADGVPRGDNFIGNKKLVKALLRELVAWRTRTKPAMGFKFPAAMELAILGHHLRTVANRL